VTVDALTTSREMTEDEALRWFGGDDLKGARLPR